ncbi:hypothetical protein SATMO3_46390 [Sporomusa aerivorans]
MLTYNFMSSLNKSLGRQTDLQEKLSDGKAIHRPSDDPVKAVRSLRFNISLRGNEQYTQHVKDALSWMETTDSAMSDLSSLTIRAKELVVKAVSPNPDMALDAIAQELDGVINQMVQIGNTKIGDRYVFAGQNDKVQPLQRRMVTNPDGTQTEAVVYTGDNNKISMRTQDGSVTPTQDSVNLTGEQAFGPLNVVSENGQDVKTVEILNNLIKIKNVLQGISDPSTNPADVQALTKSNPVGGDITKSSTEEHNAFILRFDEITGGLPTKVSYSIDGGVTWESSDAIPPKISVSGGIVTLTDSKGLGSANPVVYTLAADTDNKSGDTYTLPISAGGRDLEWLSKVGLYMVDNAHNHLLQAQTEIGARMSMYTQAEALLEKNNVIITGDVAANEDLDIPKALVEYKTSESVYRTALAIGAKLMPPSLADFLN